MDKELVEFSKLLWDAFNKVVFLYPRRISGSVYSSSNLMRQALFDGMYKDAPPVLEHFGIDIGKFGIPLNKIKDPISKLVFLTDYTKANFPSSSNLKVLDSPKVNVETNTISCTMATLLGSYLLDQSGFKDNFYIRPSGHSVNGVRVEGEEYFVDFRNGVVLKIKRLGAAADNPEDKAELVEIIDPFGSEWYRLAVSSVRNSLSLSVAGNWHALIITKREGSLEIKGDEDEAAEKLKRYFFELAKPFDNWDLKNFSKFRRFLSPGVVALQNQKEMEEERKKVRRRQHDFDREKGISSKVAVNLVKRIAANLEVQGINPTGEEIARKIKADPRYANFRKDPRMQELFDRLKEKDGFEAFLRRRDQKLLRSNVQR